VATDQRLIWDSSLYIQALTKLMQVNESTLTSYFQIGGKYIIIITEVILKCTQESMEDLSLLGMGSILLPLVLVIAQLVTARMATLSSPHGIAPTWLFLK